MATPSNKHLLTIALAFASPTIAVLALLVGIGELGVGPATVAGLVVLVIVAAFASRPLDRLNRLQLRIEAMIARDATHNRDGGGDALTDPGGGAIGDLIPSPTDHDRCAHSRCPIDMIFQG